MRLVCTAGRRLSTFVSMLGTFVGSGLSRFALGIDLPSMPTHGQIGSDLGARGCPGSVLDIDVFLRTGETYWI